MYNLYSRLPGAIQWGIFGAALVAAINGKASYMLVYNLADHMHIDLCDVAFKTLDAAFIQHRGA